MQTSVVHLIKLAILTIRKSDATGSLIPVKLQLTMAMEEALMAEAQYPGSTHFMGLEIELSTILPTDHFAIFCSDGSIFACYPDGKCILLKGIHAFPASLSSGK